MPGFVCRLHVERSRMRSSGPPGPETRPFLYVAGERGATFESDIRNAASMSTDTIRDERTDATLERGHDSWIHGERGALVTELVFHGVASP